MNETTTLRPGIDQDYLTGIAAAAYGYGKEEAFTDQEMAYAAGVMELASYLSGFDSHDQVLIEILDRARRLPRRH